MKALIKKALREAYGEFTSPLEHQYENVIIEGLSEENMDVKRKWITYNQVVLELKNNLRNELKVKELQYYLTDDKDPNQVCINVMEDIKDSSPEIKRLYEKISNF